MIKSLPTWQEPCQQIPTPQTAAAPTKIQPPLFVGQGGRFAAGARPGMAALQRDCSFISIEVEGETWVKHLQKGSPGHQRAQLRLSGAGLPKERGAGAHRKQP